MTITVTFRCVCDECGAIGYYDEYHDVCPGDCSGPPDEQDDRGYTAYYGVEWETIRERVLERDNYTCQHDGCDITHSEHQERSDLFPPDGGLHIHHIEKASTFDSYEEMNSLENLVALCANCHRAAENADIF